MWYKNINKKRLYSLISICETHSKRLKASLSFLKELLPLSVDKYKALTEHELAYIDQMSYRYGKLQETMGKLLRTLLITLEEDVKSSPFIDVLNTAEKTGIIDSAQEWIMLRELRNILTHEYSEKVDDIIEGINKLYEISHRLLKIYEELLNYINNKKVLE